MFDKNMNFGLELTKLDGTEHVFAASSMFESMPKEYSFKRFLPAVLNQGTESICVPCSISAYLNWKKNLETGSRKDNRVNYHEIYGIRSNPGDGMTFKEALHYLRHHGVSSDSGNLMIKEYAIIRSFSELRAAIIMNGPCLGALPVYSDRPEFWNKMPGDGFYGYHAISIVGYDEDGFIIRNSWGRDFGDDGYSKMLYEDYNKFLEIWTIID